jgi:hypothetical protein
MKWILTLIGAWVRHETVHDDTLRANQFTGPIPAFSPWLALVKHLTVKG